MTEGDLGTDCAAQKNSSPTPASVRGAAVFICFSLQTEGALGSLIGPKGVALSFQGMREKEKAKENGVRDCMSSGTVFFESESEAFRGHSQCADISLSHCRCFLFYQMDREVLKYTSVFVLCLISSGSFTLCGGFKVSSEAATPFAPLSGHSQGTWQPFTRTACSLPLSARSSIASFEYLLCCRH